MFHSVFPQVRCETVLGRINVFLSVPSKVMSPTPRPTDSHANILPCNNHNLLILRSNKHVDHLGFRVAGSQISLNSSRLFPPVFNLYAKLSKQAASSLVSIFSANILLEIKLNRFPQIVKLLLWSDSQHGLAIFGLPAQRIPILRRTDQFI